jgi:hypothetical protein
MKGLESYHDLLCQSAGHPKLLKMPANLVFANDEATGSCVSTLDNDCGTARDVVSSLCLDVPLIANCKEEQAGGKQKNGRRYLLSTSTCWNKHAIPSALGSFKTPFSIPPVSKVRPTKLSVLPTLPPNAG